MSWVETIKEVDAGRCSLKEPPVAFLPIVYLLLHLLLLPLACPSFHITFGYVQSIHVILPLLSRIAHRQISEDGRLNSTPWSAVP